jgi:hypothetical protein
MARKGPAKHPEKATHPKGVVPKELQGRDHVADGRKGGKALTFETPEALQEAIDRYFASRGNVYAKDDKGLPFIDRGQPVILERKPMTLNGLIYDIGLCSREGFDEYGRRDGYADIVRRAKLKIANFYESLLSDPNIRAQGPAFALERMLSATTPKEVKLDVEVDEGTTVTIRDLRKENEAKP